MIDFTLFISTAARPLLAYLDPGTGSYAIQIILAGLFGGLFAVRQSWSSVKGWYASTVGGRAGREDTEASRPGYDG